MDYKQSPNQWSPNVTSGGSGSMQTVSEPLNSPVRDRLSNTEQWLSDLHQTADMLEKRLDTILTPIPPTGQGVGSPTPTQPKSHLNGRIEILNEGFSHLNARLNQILSRIEL